MATFRDFLETDLGAFFNPDEFGDVHNIDGKNILVVIDEDLLKDRPRQPADLYHATAGVYVGTKLIFAKLSDLGERPVVGQHMRIDGELYLVANCNEQMGVLEITMEANEA